MRRTMTGWHGINNGGRLSPKCYQNAEDAFSNQVYELTPGWGTQSVLVDTCAPRESCERGGAADGHEAGYVELGDDVQAGCIVNLLWTFRGLLGRSLHGFELTSYRSPSLGLRVSGGACFLAAWLWEGEGVRERVVSGSIRASGQMNRPRPASPVAVEKPDPCQQIHVCIRVY